MSKTTISKATVNNSGVHVSFFEPRIVEGKSKKKVTGVDDPEYPHPDLLLTLKVLLPHFICLSPLDRLTMFRDINSDYIQKRKILDEKDDAEIFVFAVNGVTFSGSDDKAGVQLIGRAIDENGKVVSMVTPLHSMSDESTYTHQKKFKEDLHAFLDEIEKYIGGKKLQQTLEFAGADKNSQEDER